MYLFLIVTFIYVYMYIHDFLYIYHVPVVCPGRIKFSGAGIKESELLDINAGTHILVLSRAASTLNH